MFLSVFNNSFFFFLYFVNLICSTFCLASPDARSSRYDIGSRGVWPMLLLEGFLLLKKNLPVVFCHLFDFKRTVSLQCRKSLTIYLMLMEACYPMFLFHPDLLLLLSFFDNSV